MKKRIFWIGALFGLAVTLILELAVAASGVINMTASQRAGWLDGLGHLAWESSLMWRAPGTENPHSGEAQAVEAGLEHFRASCVHCHGAPQVKRAEWAKGMLPMPPDLTGEEVQGRTDGELFHVITHGVRMAGMPPFGQDHSDEEIWDMVTFIRTLPDLDEQQTQSLREAVGSHGHGSGGSDHSRRNGAEVPDDRPHGHGEHRSHEHGQGTAE